jgi:hypothetical protein
MLPSILSSLIAALISDASIPADASSMEMVQPRQLIIDSGIPKEQVDAQVLAARRYDTFWNTGDEALARAALAGDFIDRTLPPGRAQGIPGPLAYLNLCVRLSRTFNARWSR